MTEPHRRVYNGQSHSSDHSSGSATTNDSAISDFEKKLAADVKALRSRLSDVETRLVEVHGQDAAILKAMEDERDSIIQCLRTCADAFDLVAANQQNIFEEVTCGDNSHQVIVSTKGEPITARNIKIGSNSLQWIGQMDDATLQKLSAEHRRPQTGQSPTEKDFHNQYGPGHQLEVNILESRQSSSIGEHF